MEPLTPPECDLRGLPFMPLDVVRLTDSDLFAISTGDEFKAAVTLWCKAWLQVPAASLPNDDRILSHLSGSGARWKKLKSVALRGFVLCSDNRWYHAVIAGKAKEAWGHRLKQREKAAKRWDKDKPEPGNPTADAVAYAPVMQGTGTGNIPLSNDNGEVVDFDKLLWESGKAYLKPYTKGDPGSLIGKWVKTYGKAETRSALAAAQSERAFDPVSFVTKVLKNGQDGNSDNAPWPC